MLQLDPEFWFSNFLASYNFWNFIFNYLLILPKISDNLETRKSQVLDNLELAENKEMTAKQN